MKESIENASRSHCNRLRFGVCSGVGEPVAVVDSKGDLLAHRLTGTNGVCRVLVDDPGTCQIAFPRLDKDAWKSKEEWEASK